MNIDLDFLKNSSTPYQHAIIISSAALLVALSLLFFGIMPARTRMSAVVKQIATEKNTLESMREDIQGTERQRAQTDTAREQHLAFLATGAIEPLLGSFAMRGKNLLDPLSQQTGFSIDSVKELPRLPIRLPAPPPEQLYARQPIEFSGHGSYNQIVAFVTAVESSLPLATLNNLRILSQPQTPERHKAIVTFEWPVKGEKLQPVVKGKDK
ncbi:MAG: hypothetical protein PHU80_02550 [Kiritimatiellae bacterium]|nr:hypothetical protein [Kiritimatiellia bacterium]